MCSNRINHTNLSVLYESPEGTWRFSKKSHKYIVILNCAIYSHRSVIHSHGLIIRSLELDNPFSRIATVSYTHLTLPTICSV